MVFIDPQDHGGTVSIVVIYSILLHFARAMIAIRLVATAGVAKMCVKCETCQETYFCRHNQRLSTGEVVRCEFSFLWVQTCMLCSNTIQPK
jgi:hypothetical protein